MKKSIKLPLWSTSFVLILGLLLFACKTTKPVSEDTANSRQTPIENSLLWKINGPDIKESYLFGTIHILPQADFELSKGVEEAFAGAEQIILELDMDDPNMQMEMMKYASMPEGQTLDQFLTEDEYAKLDKWIQKSAGIKLEMVHNLQPVLLTSLIIGEYLDGPPASYEGTFIQMAQTQKKEIFGLETVAEQMEAITEYGIENQIKDLKQMLANPEMARDGFVELVAMYKTQNVDGLYDLIQKQMSGGSLNASLLDKRNQKWVPRIQEFAAEKSCFFGVGSGHLGGEKGVIRLLRAAGYTVTAVQ